MAARHRGAFGFPAPYGHQPKEAAEVSFNMDIVDGAVASLCEAFREATRFDAQGHHVNLLFDHATAAVAVESPYTHDALRIRVKRPGPLQVRLPAWVDRQELRVEGAEAVERTEGGLRIAQPPVDAAVTLRFAWVERELILRHRTRAIRVRLRGDQVTAMDHFGTDLTFFPALAG